MIKEYLSEFLSLRAIKRDLLVVLEREGPQHGLKIKRTLDEQIESEITIGRLYPNLDELAEAGLIEKGSLTQRANCYRISDHGKRVLASYRRWISESKTTGGPYPLQRSMSLHLNAPGEEDE